MREHSSSGSGLWTGVMVLLAVLSALAVPLSAADSSCIPELTVARQPAAPLHTTPEVELRLGGIWTCGGDVPVLGEVTRTGSTTRVVLEADAGSAGNGSGEPFELAGSLGPLPPGENLVEVYLEDGEETRLRAVDRFEVGADCFRLLSFGGQPVLAFGDDVILVGVGGFLCSGSISLDEIEVVGKTIRLKAHATFSGEPAEETYFRLRRGVRPLKPGRYTLEFLVDTAEAPWAGYQLVATGTWNLYGLCEPEPGGASRRDGPAATLLVPYFEVDLKNADGPNTLFSVGNASAEPVLANVVLWTDWGIPSYAFTLYLAPDELRPIDLKGLFAGRAPESGPGGGTGDLPPGCQDPLAVPPPDAATLRAMHTGQARPSDGLCTGDLYHPGLPDIAYGYVTVDVVYSCPPGGREGGRIGSGAAIVPGDKGYFALDGTGRASDSNVLWGDILYVRPAEDSAQGIAAVALPAAPERFTGEGPHVTFYREFVGEDGSDGRVPLGTYSQMRLFNGGSLGMQTDLLIWTEAIGPIPPQPCNRMPFGPTVIVGLEVWDQTGNELLERTGWGGWVTRSRRLDVEETVHTPFGQLGVSTVQICYSSSCDGDVPLQTLVIPVYSAAGRFSVAYESMPLDLGCRW